MGWSQGPRSCHDRHRPDRTGIRCSSNGPVGRTPGTRRTSTGAGCCGCSGGLPQNGIRRADSRPYTTDGDVALDPSVLGDDPLLEEAMRQQGFRLLDRGGGAVEPGTWVGVTEVDGTLFEVPVDLIVPEAFLVGGKTHGARLPVHGKRVAKRTHGLEAALVDQGLMPLSGLALGDDRCIEIAVAGVAALMVSKVIKIRDRVADEGRVHRQKDKDAGDVLRRVRSTPVAVMAERLEQLRSHALAGNVTREAVEGLDALFRAPGSPGVVMAVRAVELDIPKVQVEAQLTGYVRELQRRLAT